MCQYLRKIIIYYIIDMILIICSLLSLFVRFLYKIDSSFNIKKKKKQKSSQYITINAYDWFSVSPKDKVYMSNYV